ncbi:MAG: c-type cytochrome [Bacteroidetes bacterium]|nr:c-type cytochrome [Bacteroidota bacterium]
MKRSKTLTVMSVLLTTLVVLTAANPLPKRNLRVLPKDIPDATLDSIMKQFNKGLGVACNFCHVRIHEQTDSLNYASDKDPMKITARKMLRMTIEINRKNFWTDKSKKPHELNEVDCYTCHKGEAWIETGR